MVFSKHTTYTITSPNYSSRSGRAITGWIIHHNASTNGEYVLALMHTGDKQVSANYQIMSNGDIVGVVDESLRSWSVSNADWDGHSITFETENSTGAPNWGISSAARTAIAKVIADSSDRYGIPINSTTVRGHNQGSGQGDGGSYATACPGPSMDVAGIIVEANALKTSSSGGGSTPINNESGDIDMALFVQYRTALKSSGGKALDGAVFAIGPGVINYFGKEWSSGGPQAAAFYGGLHTGINDATFSRLLDANGISWSMMSKSVDTGVPVNA